VEQPPEEPVARHLAVDQFVLADRLEQHLGALQASVVEPRASSAAMYWISRPPARQDPASWPTARRMRVGVCSDWAKYCSAQSARSRLDVGHALVAVHLLAGVDGHREHALAQQVRAPGRTKPVEAFSTASGSKRQ
jgi:hypothetical protein